MEVKKIIVKENEFIRIATNGRQTMYSYYKNDEITKCTSNVDSFILYLTSIKVPKKCIKEVK